MDPKKGYLCDSVDSEENTCRSILKTFVHQSIPKSQELGFFENKLANATTAGTKQLFKCPRVVAQKCFIFFVSQLLSIKSKLIQAKFSPS